MEEAAVTGDTAAPAPASVAPTAATTTTTATPARPTRLSPGPPLFTGGLADDPPRDVLPPTHFHQATQAAAAATTTTQAAADEAEAEQGSDDDIDAVANVVDVEEGVFVFGSNSDCQLGLGHSRERSTPALLSHLTGRGVVAVAAGGLHVVAITFTGDV